LSGESLCYFYRIANPGPVMPDAWRDDCRTLPWFSQTGMEARIDQAKKGRQKGHIFDVLGALCYLGRGQFTRDTPQ
jgi:hypothetical protein